MTFRARRSHSYPLGNSVEKKGRNVHPSAMIRKDPEMDFRFFPQDRNDLFCFIAKTGYLAVVDLVAGAFAVVDFVAAAGGTSGTIVAILIRSTLGILLSIYDLP